MNKNDFQLWGIELGREEFVQAIAALGIFTGEKLYLKSRREPENNVLNDKDIIDKISSLIRQNQTLKWRLNSLRFLAKKIKFEAVPGDLKSFPQDAGTFVDIWKKITEEFGEKINASDVFPALPPIRIEIQPGVENIFNHAGNFSWELEQLSYPEVHAASVYVRNDDQLDKIIWDFPLRIGFLNDPLSQRLRSEIEPLKFFDQTPNKSHIRIVNIEGGAADCDILLLPQDLRAAVAALLQSPNTLRTGCLIITGNINEASDRINPLLETLRTQARASSVCLLPLPPNFTRGYFLNSRQVWFKELVSRLAHNDPLDTALFRASRNTNVQAPLPVFFASPELIKAAQISVRIDKFREQIDRIEKNRKPPVEGQSRRGIEDNPNNPFTKKWIVKPEKNYRSSNAINKEWDSALSFDLSSGDERSASFSEIKRTIEEKLETSAPVPRFKPRWIQAEIWEFGARDKKRSAARAPGLITGTDYSIDIFIGQKTAASITADKTFNEEELPPGENEHELTVFFTESNISPEPKTAKIILPRRGDSSRCTFFIRIPPDGLDKISARIIIAYKNRVLQTALLEAAVYPDRGKSAADKDKKIELLVESAARPGLQGLTERKFFDAAFILNHNQADIPQLTKLVNNEAELISIEGIADSLRWFDEAISEIADKPEKFETLTSKKSQDLLRNLALNGVVLYRSLMMGRSGGILATAERIQIISVKQGSRLPIEFVYSRMAPEDTAPLCEHAETALKEGRCPATCPTGPDEEKTICPLGFWGLNRVIERHAYDPRALKETSNSDFALQSDPIENRKRLDVLKKSIFAASDNVDAYETNSTQTVKDALDRATGKQSNNVKSWLEWKEDIKARAPSLLVIMPHTLKDGSNLPNLEISADQKLNLARITKNYILGPQGAPNPVVFLMGCKTDSPDIAYESFILGFRELGAALVIGTGSTILGRHAAPVTCAFINALAEIKPAGVSFGDIMLQVRRQMVSQGIIMALCLTSYGDTDWLV